MHRVLTLLLDGARAQTEARFKNSFPTRRRSSETEIGAVRRKGILDDLYKASICSGLSASPSRVISSVAASACRRAAQHGSGPGLHRVLDTFYVYDEQRYLLKGGGRPRPTGSGPDPHPGRQGRYRIEKIDFTLARRFEASPGIKKGPRFGGYPGKN